MTEFYVEGHTAEGAPYGPVHVLTTPLRRDIFEELMEGFDALQETRGEAEHAREEESARQGAWRDAVARALKHPHIVTVE